MYHVNDMPPPLPTELIGQLQAVETATVGHWHLFGFMDPGIQPILGGKRVVGNAVTVAIPGADSTLLHHATGLLRPGDVLVVDRLGDRRHACWGGRCHRRRQGGWRKPPPACVRQAPPNGAARPARRRARACYNHGLRMVAGTALSSDTGCSLAW